MWVNKEPTLSHKIGEQKGAVVIVLAAVMVAYVLSVVVAVFWNHMAFALVQGLLFLAVGLLHLSRLRSDFQAFTTTQKWVYSLVVGISIFLLFGLASFWHIRLPFVTMLAGAVAFLLPFVLSELVRTYMQLAFGNAAPWQVSNEVAVAYPDVYLAGMPVRFRILPEGGEQTAFQAEFRTLAEMKLGEVFYDMMQKQAKKGIGHTALFDNKNQPYQWLFFTTNFMGWSRALDPSLSLAENSLKKDSVIYVQRLPASLAAISQKQKELNFLL